MKSLSWLVFLGTSLALLIGGVFAVSPALATSPASAEAPILAVEPDAAAFSGNTGPHTIVRQPLAPLTGAGAEAAIAAPVTELAGEPAMDPGAALAGSFTTSISKAPAADSIQAAPPVTSPPSLSSFAAGLANGTRGQISGIFVQDVLAYPVGGQPSGDPGYVTSNPGQVTRFGMAGQYGSHGFLAHNYLAGAAFFQLSAGQIITLVHGDGSTSEYRIVDIRSFQALTPDSTQSRFVDLESGKELSASNLFHQIYNSNHPVVLQTCIAKDGISTWGRMFILAVPVNG
ncbi:MAG: hypothetical protein KIS85_08730 [Anaerolineales bacterium]|nr:hypothetical protein [Anaerolineales bacterium]